MYCISALGAFDEYYRTNTYDLKSNELLEKYLKENGEAILNSQVFRLVLHALMRSKAD